MDHLPVLPLAVLLFFAALVFFFLARRQQHKSGLPAGRVIYTDTQGWLKVEKPLYSSELNLTGKPDYLVELQGQLIPVEVKSSRHVTAPYAAHVNQLIAYCLLVESCYCQRPPYGILRYPDKTFAIDFTPGLEDRVLSLLQEMQSQVSANNIDRSHQSPERCTGCGYRYLCDQALRI
jgi:CRISPR-associated exonuclease Cas4